MLLSTDSPDETPLQVRARWFGPSVLSPFADDLAARLSRLTAGPVLEVMADIGTLTQAAAIAGSAFTSLIATDPDPLALAHAAERSGTARVAWRQADPAALPFADDTASSIICLFAMAERGDRSAIYREVRRVLQPGGRFLFTVPRGLGQNPVAGCVHDALAGLFPDDPPRYLSTQLHGYHETAVIDDELSAAGFTEATYTILQRPFSARSAAEVALGYCLGTGLQPELEARGADTTTQAIQAVEAALIRQFGTGPITAPMRANVVMAGG